MTKLNDVIQKYTNTKNNTGVVPKVLYFGDNNDTFSLLAENCEATRYPAVLEEEKELSGKDYDAVVLTSDNLNLVWDLTPEIETIIYSKTGRLTLSKSNSIRQPMDKYSQYKRVLMLEDDEKVCVFSQNTDVISSVEVKPEEPPTTAPPTSSMFNWNTERRSN